MNSNQDFYALRNKCLEKGVLFKDNEFAPSMKIINYNKPVQWLRPREICDNPKFEVDGFSRFDVRQGRLGDCWFLAALANLAENPSLLSKVIPKDNDLEKNYAGIFHFRFWKNGKWTTIIIDDRLPTFNRKTIYMRTPKGEFWPALLEKAYAKLYGSYPAIEGGHISEAMVDFTGGVIERFGPNRMKRNPEQLFKSMMKGHKKGSLIGAAIMRGNDKRSKGLVEGHAYSITHVSIIQSRNIRLVRIKNPWSNATEWTGPFSDKSKEWNLVSTYEKLQMQVKFEEDGEFFMIYTDFLQYFDLVELCHISPDHFETNEQHRKWQLSTYDGAWSYGNNQTPQIIVQLIDPDDQDDDDYCTMIVALMQKNQRSQQKRSSPIGFKIYKLSAEDVRQRVLGSKFFAREKPIAVTKLEPYREISERFRCLPGFYMILPMNETSSSQFMLRIFTEAVPGNTRSSVIVKVNDNFGSSKVMSKVDTKIIIPESIVAGSYQRQQSSWKKCCQIIIAWFFAVVLTWALIAIIVIALQQLFPGKLNVKF